MRYFLASFISLFCFYQLRSQTFSEIEIIAQENDEPPTKEGRPVHQLTFHLTGNDLTLANYKISDFAFSTNPIVIPENLVDSLSELVSNPRTDFVIRRTVEGEQVQPIKLSLDSLNFCIDNAYMRKRRISTGGISIKIKVKDRSAELLVFEFDSSEPELFNYQNYLTLYPVLENKLPENLPGSYLFNDSYLMKKVTEYFETIRCEDYYYGEFVNEHPERTPQQNRTREGWNFDDYMTKRIGN
ncbi:MULTISPECIES: hypothetical protein [unclassified Imperialibacter]|uniref:hypothetical protein n=1 Tax=unclassified Imperialibacter TaxID=2629706 RepID=UPI00125EBB39|nr:MULTISPECIES: hypothetical protein [unclassified Imperialibacter]